MPVNQSVFGGLFLGDDLVLDAERLPERGDVGRRAGPEVPVGPELLLVGGQAGHGVAARVDRGLDEDDAVGQPGGAQVALQGDEGAGHERALVLAQGEEGGEDHDLAPSAARETALSVLVDERDVLWRGAVEHQALARRRRGGRGRSAGGEQGAEGRARTRTVTRGPAGRRSGSGVVLPGGQEGEGEVGQGDQRGGDPAGEVVEDRGDGRRLLELLLAEAERALVGRLGGPAEGAVEPRRPRCAPARSWSPCGPGPSGPPAAR